MNSTPPSASDPELRMLGAELDAALASGTASGRAAAAGRSPGAPVRPGMERHRRIAGLLTMVMGGLVVLGSVATVGLLALAGYLSGSLATGVSVRPLLLAVALGTAGMIAGLAFTRGHPASRVPVAVFAVVSLVAFPVGTAAGVYVLWTLVMMGRTG